MSRHISRIPREPCVLGPRTRKLRTGFVFLFVFYTSLVFAQEAPRWVTRQTVVYPPDKYLTGTGEGRSEEEARALAQISRFFQTTVDDTRELFYKREPSIREGVVLCRTVPDDPRERQFASMKDNGTEYTFWGEGYSPSRHPFENKFLFVRQGNIYEMDVETTQVSEFYSDSDGWACAYPKYS